MDRLKSLLMKHERVGLDTSIFIYYLESNPLLERGRRMKNYLTFGPKVALRIS